MAIDFSALGISTGGDDVVRDPCPPPEFDGFAPNDADVPATLFECPIVDSPLMDQI